MIVVQSSRRTLIAIVRARRARARSPSPSSFAIPRSACLERDGIGDVGGEGDLARARLRDADRLDGRVVVEMRARVQLARHALAEALREELLRGGLQLADRMQREAGEALRGLRADALEQAHRVACEVRDGLLAAHRDERRRLERRARGLCDQPRGPDPDRQRHPGALGTAATSARSSATGSGSCERSR